MKEAAPYKCDYCITRKGPTNHWWMRNRHAAAKRQQFLLERWNADLADAVFGLGAGEPLFEHICSESCAAKALSQHMARVSQLPKTMAPLDGVVGDGVATQEQVKVT